jgi:hypothetical protein
MSTEHTQVSGWVGPAGECGGAGVECACGTIFDGFDTLAGAKEQLDQHIDDCSKRAAEIDPAVRERAEFVAGLRELADWYAVHPEVPIGYKPTYRYVVLANNDATGSAEIQVFADALGVEVTRTLYAGHYHATAQFAGLTFEAYYVPREEAHRYTADQQLLKAAKAELAANDSRAATAVPQPTGQGSPQVRDQSPGSGPGHNAGEGQGTRPAGAGGVDGPPAPATHGHPCIDVPPNVRVLADLDFGDPRRAS